MILRAKRPYFDQPLFETSTNLDEAIEFPANYFVFHHPQL
jgi:hypothetical protein